MKNIIIPITTAIMAAVLTVSYMKFGHMLQKHEPLPVVATDSGFMELLDRRMSGRNFASTEIDNDTLSKILWVAYGKNSRGTRTIPTSMGLEDLNVYVISKTGAYLYDGENNNLIKKSDNDLRPIFAQQNYVMTAPVTILYTGTDPMNSPIHAGAALQNVGIYLAEQNMAGVVRMMFDKTKIKSELNMASDELPIVSQTIGFRK